jgi:hypothetical protein
MEVKPTEQDYPRSPTISSTDQTWFETPISIAGVHSQRSMHAPEVLIPEVECHGCGVVLGFF